MSIIHQWDAVPGPEGDIGRSESIRRYLVEPNLSPGFAQAPYPSLTDSKRGTALCQEAETVFFCYWRLTACTLFSLFNDFILTCWLFSGIDILPPEHWDRVFESLLRHGLFSPFLLCVSRRQDNLISPVTGLQVGRLGVWIPAVARYSFLPQNAPFQPWVYPVSYSKDTGFLSAGKTVEMWSWPLTSI